MLAESAVAVESEIVGKDSDAVLIGGLVELRKACSCALLAASSAAAAVCASALDFGEVEKKCAILLAFAWVVLTRLPPFSVCGEKEGQGVGGELLRNGLDKRRGMAEERRSEVQIEIQKLRLRPQLGRWSCSWFSWWVMEERKASVVLRWGRCILVAVRGRESALNTLVSYQTTSLIRTIVRESPWRRGMRGTRRHSKDMPDDGEERG
jgi:hypothetical protein